MKNYLLLAVWLLCRMAAWAEDPPAQEAELVQEPVQEAAQEAAQEQDRRVLPFDWSLLYAGSWEDFSDEHGTLHNRGELKINWNGFTMREQVLDRRPLTTEFDWGNSDKAATNFNGALYHQPTGSRLLFGVIDEWGLPARIRNPWIRSPPYAENHKPLFADLRTAASGTKDDEAYLYLSSPVFDISDNTKLRGFVSAQADINSFNPAFSGGLDLSFPRKTNLLLETFYTGTTLEPKKSSSWFSNSPPLPQRKFRLYAAALLFSNPLLAVSSDIARSQTFAVGTDIYCNLGITLTPRLPFGARERPLSLSFAADGAGPQFVYRDGVSHGDAFRSAVKIEWKGRSSSLLRLNTVLRAPAFGEDFTRSSTGFYFRFPGNSFFSNNFPVRLTRISLTADRNADNPQKISDGLSGKIGFSVNLQQLSLNTPFGLDLSGSIKRLTASQGAPSPYPVSDIPWILDTAEIKGEISWFPANYQFKTGLGYSKNAKFVEKWEFSTSAAIKFKQGRLGFAAVSREFPGKWDLTVSWRLEFQ